MSRSETPIVARAERCERAGQTAVADVAGGDTLHPATSCKAANALARGRGNG